MSSDLDPHISALFAEVGNELRFTEISKKVYRNPSNRAKVELVRRLKNMVDAGYLEKRNKGHKMVFYVATERMLQEKKKIEAHQTLDAVLKAQTEEEIKTNLVELLRLINIALPIQGAPLLSTVNMIANTFHKITKAT